MVANRMGRQGPCVPDIRGRGLTRAHDLAHQVHPWGCPPCSSTAAQTPLALPEFGDHLRQKLNIQHPRAKSCHFERTLETKYVHSLVQLAQESVGAREGMSGKPCS